jgi:hypothetical protein
MDQPWLLIGGIATVALLYVALPVALSTYARLRPPRRVACPALGREAVIAVDARRAAATAAFTRMRLRVARCSRWPDLAGCGQECLADVEEAPRPGA